MAKMNTKIIFCFLGVIFVSLCLEIIVSLKTKTNMNVHKVSDVIKAGGIEKYAKLKGLKSVSAKLAGSIEFTDKEWKKMLKLMKED